MLQRKQEPISLLWNKDINQRYFWDKSNLYFLYFSSMIEIFVLFFLKHWNLKLMINDSDRVQHSTNRSKIWRTHWHFFSDNIHNRMSVCGSCLTWFGIKDNILRRYPACTWRNRTVRAWDTTTKLPPKRIIIRLKYYDPELYNQIVFVQTSFLSNEEHLVSTRTIQKWTRQLVHCTCPELF